MVLLRRKKCRAPTKKVTEVIHRECGIVIYLDLRTAFRQGFELFAHFLITMYLYVIADIILIYADKLSNMNSLS